MRRKTPSAKGPYSYRTDYLGVNRTAKHAEIIKAYRKKSKSMHPDKVKRAFIAEYRAEKLHENRKKNSSNKKHNRKSGVHVAKNPSKRQIDRAVKLATQRYARLAVIRDILTGPGRERYDHFLKNGFPMWKGTGYYYSRFRPGLGSVLLGLYVVFAGLAHYAAMKLNYTRQKQFTEFCMKYARRTAWGDEMGIGAVANLGTGADAGPSPVAAPTAETNGTEGASGATLTRRQKRMMDRESRKESKKNAGKNAPDASSPMAEVPVNVPGSYGERRRVDLPNGVPVIVDSMGDVFIEEHDDEGNTWEEILNIDMIPKPQFTKTAMFTFPVWVMDKVKSKFVREPREEEE